MVKSLGKKTVTTAGTRVQVSATRIICQSVQFQQVPAQTGKIYIGDVTVVNTSAGTGQFGVLPIPTANILPSQSFTIVTAANGLNLQDFYVDSEVNGEGVLVSYIES